MRDKQIKQNQQQQPQLPPTQKTTPTTHPPQPQPSSPPTSIFDHQITLKGLQYIGGLPEHIIKRAHLEAHDVMTTSKTSTTLRITESGGRLADVLDGQKTVGAFAVVGVGGGGSGGEGEEGEEEEEEEARDFMGLISRARWFLV